MTKEGPGKPLRYISDTQQERSQHSRAKSRVQQEKIDSDLMGLMKENQGTDIQLSVSLQTKSNLTKSHEALLQRLGLNHTVDVKELEWAFWLGFLSIANILLLAQQDWVLHMQCPHHAETAHHEAKRPS